MAPNETYLPSLISWAGANIQHLDSSKTFTFHVVAQKLTRTKANTAAHLSRYLGS